MKAKKSLTFSLSLCGAFATAVAKTLVKAINAATGIQHFLLTGIKGVACRTYVQVYIFTQGRARLNLITTTASCGHFFILWMYICFHACFLSFCCAATRSGIIVSILETTGLARGYCLSMINSQVKALAKNQAMHHTREQFKCNASDLFACEGHWGNISGNLIIKGRRA